MRVAVWRGHGRRVAPLVLVVAAALCAGVVFAQGPAPDLKVTVSVEREVTRTGPDGREVVTRERVDLVRPGDVLVYTVRAHNRGQGPAVGARVKDPIPSGTVLIVDSVGTDDGTPSASLDGGETWQAFPATVTSRNADGRDEEVPAPPEAYTDLRWQLADPMNPGEARSFEFKVRVL